MPKLSPARSVSPSGAALREPEATPRYVVVARALAAAIADGRYPVGSTLPTEHELCDAFAISRFTVREALRQLQEAGLIIRKPRLGTMVIARQRRAPYAQVLGSLDDLLQYAIDTELRIISADTIQVDEILARELPIAPGEKWLFDVGIRFRKDDDLPICITRIYINPAFTTVAQRLENRSQAIYRQIEQRDGVAVARVEQRISAVSLLPEDALRLNAKANIPALRTLRLYYDEGGRLLEASDSIHPGERFRYTMTISKSE